MPRVRKVNQSADLMVDPSRPFAIPIAQSNLTRFQAQTVPLTLRELMNVRQSVAPAQKGVYTTQTRRITKDSVGTLQSNAMVGDGFISDGIKYGRRKLGDLVEYAGDTGIDYASALGKKKLRGVSGKIRGDGFLRNLAGSAVSGFGNFLGNTIKGGRGKKRRGGQSMMYLDDAVPLRQVRRGRPKKVEGDGFLRNLAGTAVSGLGNFLGNTIKGGKGKGRKRKGKGLVAPGMRY